MINVKFFAGRLDQRITHEWTQTISKHPADQVLSALLASPVEVYNYCAESNWQGTVKAFAPLVDNLAKQNQLQITSPETDAQRNKLLADFATAQIAEACKSQNDGLPEWMKNRLSADFQNLSAAPINKSQQAETSKLSSEEDLKAPVFSSSLEAEVYRLSKYDDEKKAEYAEQAVSAVEAKVKAEALEKAMVEEQENVWVMSM